jgi:hypothetical protein
VGQAAALATRAKLAHIRGDLAALERDARRSAGLFAELGDCWGVLQASASPTVPSGPYGLPPARLRSETWNRNWNRDWNGTGWRRGHGAG